MICFDSPRVSHYQHESRIDRSRYRDTIMRRAHDRGQVGERGARTRNELPRLFRRSRRGTCSRSMCIRAAIRRCLAINVDRSVCMASGISRAYQSAWRLLRFSSAIRPLDGAYRMSRARLQNRNDTTWSHILGAYSNTEGTLPLGIRSILLIPTNSSFEVVG